MKLTCRQVAEILNEFVEGALTQERTTHVQVHLEACPPCVAFANSYRVTIKISQKLQPRPVPETLRAKFEQAVKELKKEQA